MSQHSLVRSAILASLIIGLLPAETSNVTRLIDQLRNTDPQVRFAAAEELGRLGSAAEPAEPALIDALRQAEPPSTEHGLVLDTPIDQPEPPDVRRAAIEALGKIGPPAQRAVPALEIALLHGDRTIRSSIAVSLGQIGGPALRSLISMLRDGDNKVRTCAIFALKDMALASNAVVPALVEVLNDGNQSGRIRKGVIDTLEEIGPVAQAAVPALTNILKDRSADQHVHSGARHAAASALGAIGVGAREAVPALKDALKDVDDEGTCSLAAVALGKIGLAAQAAMPDLVDVLQRKDYSRGSAAAALVTIAKALQDAMEVRAIDELKGASEALRKAGFPAEAAETHRAMAYLVLVLQASALHKALAWPKNHPLWTTIIAVFLIFVLWAFLLRYVILTRWPLRVFVWNEALTVPGDPAEVEVQVPGAKIKITLRSLLKHATLIGHYHYHPRVLDAWVENHVGPARTGFQSLPTVEARKTFVALPVMVNRKQLPALAPQHLHSTTARESWRLVITGEGGLGKTSLACQLALWAMADCQAERLCPDRRMLPVLLEPQSVKFDVRSDVPTFCDILRGNFRKLLAIKDPIPVRLFEQLLRDRRVLVIMDGLSEMVDTSTGPGTARPEHPEFPVNALVVTSRGDEKLTADLTIEPQRIDSTHLLVFINSYLTEAGQKQLTDSDLFEASRRLAELVTIESGITPLLARLFAEQLVGLQKRKEPIQKLPGNVPELMLAYLNSLNRDRKKSEPDDPTLHRAAKIAAWECLSATFRPGQPGSENAIRDALAQSRLDTAFLDRLVELRLVNTDEPAKTQVRFALDALCEYLAAMKVLDDHTNPAESWHAFLEEADKKPGAPKSIRGFLLALRDCCQVQVPKYPALRQIVDELAKRAGLDPEAVSVAHHRRRAEQLIQYLMSSEPADRAHAAAELSSGGPVAEAALPELVGCLENEDLAVRCEATVALMVLGRGAQAIVPSLTELMKSDDPGIRMTAALVFQAVTPNLPKAAV